MHKIVKVGETFYTNISSTGMNAEQKNKNFMTAKLKFYIFTRKLVVKEKFVPEL